MYSISFLRVYKNKILHLKDMPCFFLFFLLCVFFPLR